MTNKHIMPNKYRAIQAWGNMMGSFDSYICNEQRRASKQGAPLTAVYDSGKEWKTIDDIKSIDTLRTLAIYLASK